MPAFCEVAKMFYGIENSKLRKLANLKMHIIYMVTLLWWAVLVLFYNRTAELNMTKMFFGCQIHKHDYVWFLWLVMSIGVPVFPSHSTW